MAQGVRLSENQVQAIAESLRVTPSWRAAADHAGVNEKTLYDYRKRAEAYTNRFPDLPDETDADYYCHQSVTRWTEARSALEHELVQGILDAIPKDWKAAHAMLKSGWPQDYSDRVELTGAGGGPVQISTDEARAQLEASLAQVKAKREAAGDGPASADAPSAGNDPQAE